MADGRIPLKKGYQLVADKEKKYVIESILGRGGSCIVYEASYKDRQGMPHKVRIKECYPAALVNLSRNTDGSMNVPEQAKLRFDEAKKSFTEAYNRNVALRNMEGLTNSTVDVTNIYNVNNTLYSAMEYNQGENYKTYMENHPEEDLHTFLRRMVTLTKIIGEYHVNGLLHLDIKPENMLLIPETEEHMILFDFDSIIAKEDLQNGKVLGIASSEGFAAPEQINRKWEKIGQHTDIYAIGAMVFWKLFGRRPDAAANGLFAKFDMKSMVNWNDAYQPMLIRKLDEFLHKTIVGATNKRWQDTTEVLRALEELVELSDTEKVYLCDNFNYSFDGFVGRGRELEDLKAQIEEKRVVFLSGIGGIGKTELAKRYAYENRNSFRTVVFAPFAGSIADTVCGEDFNINKCDRTETMSAEEYFNYKWKTLKSLVQKNDLIILDNFDVEQDENLGRFIEELPCRLIITTREDFSDRNLFQVPVERMEQVEDLLHLFETNNEREYTEEETEALKKIIELVDGHTMTVTLIAKYLQHSEENPENFYEKLREKEGISGADEVQVEHNKDKKGKTESVYTHLLSLFNMSSFTEQEKELIMSLSLFGFVRIKKKKFLEWCDVEDNKEALRHLVKRGWIQSDKKSGKIALHQIILDLVYNHLRPTSENCPHVVASMMRYIEEDLPTYGQQWNRLLILNDVLDRIKGEDENYFKLMVAGCRLFLEWNLKEHRSQDVLDCAIYLRKKLEDGLKTVDTKQAYADIYMQSKVFELHALLETSRDWNLEEQETEAKVVLDELSGFAEKGRDILAYENNEHISAKCKVSCLWHTAASIRTMLMSLDEDFVKDNPDIANELISIAKESLDKIEKYIAAEEFSQWRNEYYEAMEGFYYGHVFDYDQGTWSFSEAYMRLYRNIKKVLFYQKKQGKKLVDSKRQILEEFAIDDEVSMDYLGALQLYTKLYKREKLRFWNGNEIRIWGYKVACCYKALEKNQKAIYVLKRIKTIYGLDETMFFMLIELLIIEGRNREANKYIRHFMGVLRKQMTEEQRRVEQIPGYDKVYAYTVNEFREWKLVNMVQQYKMTESERKREEIWSECLWTYKELARENGLADDSLLYEGGERLAEFYYLYMLQLLEEINSSKKSINMQMDMYLYMLKVCKKEEWEEKLATLFEKLTDRYKERVKEDVYLKSKLSYVFLKSMWQLNVGTKDEQKFWAKECDFCLLTLRQCVGKDNEEKLVLWDKAVGENTRYDKYDESEICYKNQFALLDPVFGLLDMEESAEYWRPSDESEPYKSDVKKNTIFFYWEKVKQRIQNVLLLDDWDKMVELVEHFYERLIQYYSYELFSREDAESWQETFTKWKEYETGSKGESFLYETHNQEFARHVADLVTFPGWINRYRPAAFLALVAVYISLTEEPDKEFLRAVYPERDGSVNLLVEKVSKKLKQTADPKFIPVVCERIEKILTWFPDDEDLQPLKQSMESFLARYQEMEFKE